MADKTTTAPATVKIKETTEPSGFAGTVYAKVSSVPADKVPAGAKVVADDTVEHDWEVVS